MSPLTIQSHRGPYQVVFEEGALRRLDGAVPADAHFLVDAKLAGLYARELKNLLSSPSVLLIEASEPNKALDKFPAYVEHLLARKIRRGQVLTVLGGGVLQDIGCFLAATLFRGMEWHFYPTTLLAQADSCIGSKSSINVGEAKNILGTFTPPQRIFVDTRVLDTLGEVDLRSGIGEMLKVHAIEGPDSFDRLAAEYPRLLTDRALLGRTVRRSLEIKKGVIERDEFDRDVRQIMNYGHSFGHAIESATRFAVPHGIAVTLGMDMANFTAARLGWAKKDYFDRMHPVLAKNYAGFEATDVPLEPFLSALGKDKKNAGGHLTLILPNAEGRVEKRSCANDAAFREICAAYLAGERRR